jgi:glycosyltransferase involved in cell wall biosynthesis
MVPFGTINLAAGAAKRHGRPIVLLPLAHVDDDFYHWKSYYRAFEQADLILATSKYAADHFYHRLGAHAVPVGAGVDSAEFEAPGVSGSRFRQKYDLQDVPLILFVGRKSLLKRYDILVKAIDLINHQYPCKLLIIGPEEDHLPIGSPNVLVLGPLARQDLIDAYDACDVFGMMSESESFGMVFLEAWMRRKPVIGNRRCGAVASLIEDGVDGFLCNNELDCAERIRDLLASPSRARAMGENGYRKTIERFTWDQIGRRVLALYEDLLASRAIGNH